ncbi:hypothetical protein MGYG_00187 [Nannizzia gypsea CBS 118893]|uniref:Uncharacterized protein n=1 Tax=Arthroderma gypseum (strain ATCC MYA-4604 / CBS 118893) TaxID=535722 RepID=E5R3M0_ARTGP|nr:hypothetical protein MGYG_00187 [Nannizzia gypsea CBS 118893]EFQ97144.1 hypothetical protein MGYG_00187 [Nannizzia gypsea CBS 118893]
MGKPASDLPDPSLGPHRGYTLATLNICRFLSRFYIRQGSEETQSNGKVEDPPGVWGMLDDVIASSQGIPPADWPMNKGVPGPISTRNIVFALEVRGVTGVDRDSAQLLSLVESLYIKKYYNTYYQRADRKQRDAVQNLKISGLLPLRVTAVYVHVNPHS